MSEEPLTTSPTPLRDRKSATPPFWLVAVFLVLVVLSWIPLVLIARARVSKSDKPRIALIQDMDEQPRYDTQTHSPVFADGRTMRLPVAGTIARGDLQGPDDYAGGFTTGDDGKPVFIVNFPKDLKLNQALLNRGQTEYNIYCLPCHGADGTGNGMVNRKALDLKGAWIPAANLHDAAIRNRPAGHLYNTIVHGIRSMPPYGAQIQNIEDRWAVVAYVRALQLSQGE